MVVQQNAAKLFVAASQIRLPPSAALGTIIPNSDVSYSIICLLLLDQNHTPTDTVVIP